MSHALIPQLHALAELLQSQPSLATAKEVVKALDKVSTSVAAAIALVESAAAGSKPEARELLQLLDEATATAADEKAVKSKLADLLGKLPPASKKLSRLAYLGLISELAVRQGKAHAAIALCQQFLNRVVFDPTGDKYELLKQVRNLGRMDDSAKKSAKQWLLSAPDKVQELCGAVGIPTTSGSARKPISLNSLVSKLMQHGERYAENAGS
jgi:hypothetical protein